MIGLQMALRWTLPRFRYDQVMDLCWKSLLPLSIVNIFVTALVMLLLGGTS
jgi:NADH-quinone oxidoreductase subunit H